MATKFKIRRKTMALVSLVMSASLIFSCLCCFISPQYIWIFAFSGFAYPILFLINFILIFYWIKYFPKNCWMPISAIFVASFFITRTFTYHQRSKAEHPIKIMTWNVKCFDLYNWSHNKETGEKMMNVIQQEKPDILCLQEFYTDTKGLKNLEFIRDQLGYKYVYFHKTLTLRKTDHWGIATFSKHPIIKQDHIEFKNTLSNGCTISDVKIDGEVFRIFNTHLQSVHFGYADYNYIDDVKSNIKLSDWEKSKSILHKMKQAYKNRAEQAEQIANAIAQSDKINIVCGDFNDIAMSYTYQKISSNLQDAFMQKGRGFSKTLDLFIPTLRIDFVLLDDQLQVENYKVLKKKLSDHFPVIVEVEK